MPDSVIFHTIRPASIGSGVSRLLQSASTAEILGVTSRGLFLRISPRQVLFLSREPWRSPLTVNLPDLPADLPLQPGDPVTIEGNTIRLPLVGLAVDLSGAQSWEAAPLDFPLLPLDEIRSRARQVAVQVYQDKKGAGLTWLLGWIFNLHMQTITYEQSDRLSSLRAAREALSADSLTSAAPFLEPFLGYGSGLTPSGDDLVLGLILLLNRAAKFMPAYLRVDALNRRLVPAAYARTTTLSANLIECASLGQADERLVMAVDGLLTGTTSVEEIAAALAGWGNSSGGDALVGMSLILSTVPFPIDVKE